MAREPIVSVVVPTRNGGRRLPQLLQALESQTLPREDFEVMIVNDNSTDDTVEVATASPIVRILNADERSGRAGVGNLGLRAANGRIVAFTDDDTIPDPHWLAHGLAAVERTAAPLVAGRIELVTSADPSIAELVDIGRQYLNQEAMVAEGYAATANLFADRALLLSIGGYRAIWTSSGQDRDLVERARTAGGLLVYCPDAMVHHPARERVKDLCRKEFRIAVGAAELRHYSVGTARGRPHAWRSPRLYVPWRHRPHWAHLRERGYSLSPTRRVQLWLTQYVCLQLAQAAGSLTGETQVRLGRVEARMDQTPRTA